MFRQWAQGKGVKEYKLQDRVLAALIFYVNRKGKIDKRKVQYYYGQRTFVPPSGDKSAKYHFCVRSRPVVVIPNVKQDDTQEGTGAAPGQDPTPKGGGGGGGLYGPQNCRTEQGALSAPEAPEILF